jgi:hypothetical protein
MTEPQNPPEPPPQSEQQRAERMTWVPDEFEVTPPPNDSAEDTKRE